MAHPQNDNDQTPRKHQPHPTPGEMLLQTERTVFFCDAVVAIAITLLALDLKVEHTEVPGRLSFQDVMEHWKIFVAFLLSFVNIANFWKTHHFFYMYIKKMNEKLLWFNVMWLFFIILLPFSTSLLSSYFGKTSVLIYSLDVLLIAIFQNMIWDYASLTPGFIKEDEVSEDFKFRTRLFCNLDMLNGILAVVVSFFSPVVACVLLITKIPTFVIVFLLYNRKIIRPKPVKSRKWIMRRPR